MSKGLVVALSGGVGGAKLALGLSRVLAPEDLLIVANTGDDFEHLGVHVSPDLDTVMYTLAGVSNRVTGWGRADETWRFIESIEQLGGPSWFKLGDKDLATNVLRTERLRAGESLSSVTRALCERLGVRHPVVPMSNDAVRTVVHTDKGRLAFQEYFVKLRCEPRLLELDFAGAQNAQPSAAFLDGLRSPDLAAVVVCPSNPYLSIAPILAMPAIDAWWRTRRVPVVAVSPIVGGQAIKGPAAKIMAELGAEVSALGVARHYGERIDAWVIDAQDRDRAGAIESLGKRVLVTDTIMRSREDAARLADEILRFLAR